MALQPCPECRRKISECAISCPHCGFSRYYVAVAQRFKCLKILRFLLLSF